MKLNSTKKIAVAAMATTAFICLAFTMTHVSNTAHHVNDEPSAKQTRANTTKRINDVEQIKKEPQLLEDSLSASAETQQSTLSDDVKTVDDASNDTNIVEQHDQPTQVPSYQANPASSMVIKDHVLDIDKSINSYIGFSRLPNTANTVFAITYADLGLFNHYGFEASAGLRSYVVDLVPGEIVMIEGVPHTVLSLDRAFYNSDNAIDDLNRAKASLGASTSFQTCNDSTGLNLTIAYLS